MTLSIKNIFRRWRLQCAGVELGLSSRIAAGISARREGGSIILGRSCQIEQGVVLHAYGGSIRCGENVFFGPYAVIYGHGGVEIGDHTLIASHCAIVAANHTVPTSGELIRFQPDIKLPVKIGRDVWLGAGAKVLGGVTIGDGCVIGAGAVVTHDLPPGSIALGIPARVAGTREKKESS